jgi:hypothetical protein
VKPADTKDLPPPQDPIATASNPDWPETPEQTRARLRAEATANRDNPNYRPEVYDSRVQQAANAETDNTSNTSRAINDRMKQSPDMNRTGMDQSAEFKRRLAMQKQGSPTTRRYLSEPPLDYRVPASSAPANELGEDEWKKENRLKKEAREKAGKSSWRDWVPWL